MLRHNVTPKYCATALAIETYAAEKAAIRARRTAGELSYPAAERARLAASIAPVKAQRAVEALAGEVADVSGVDAIADRADTVLAWQE